LVTPSDLPVSVLQANARTVSKFVAEGSSSRMRGVHPSNTLTCRRMSPTLLRDSSVARLWRINPDRVSLACSFCGRSSNNGPAPRAAARLNRRTRSWTTTWQTLPDDLKTRFPSMRTLYGELSVDIHSAIGSPELFEKARAQIVQHFDVRRMFGLAE
jgi:hypothetical protein